MSAMEKSQEATTKQSDALLTASTQRRFIDLLLLYVSKSGAVFVGLLILPFFNRVLGPDQFGVVALILTLQAFLLFLDFGMATVVGRDLAVAETTASQRYITWRAAEHIISLIYAALIFPVLLATWALSDLLNPAEVAACVVLFWSLNVQNIGQNALLARHLFIEAALLQATGVVARHGLTAIALAYFSPTLTCFVVIQAAVSVVQMMVTRWRCMKVLLPESAEPLRKALLKRAKSLFHTGKPLMLFGLSGAAVMQLDKVIVTSFMSSRDLAPYFLAANFCLTPISVLAAPVAQFFQPRIVRAMSSPDRAITRRTISQFTYLIVCCALLPTAAIWLFREPLIALWLHGSPESTLVSQYSAILLPGIAIGVLGYVPYTILVACQDYPFQAKFSIAMTVLTLCAAMIAAIQGSVLTICVIYALYHSSSTIGSWWRCVQLKAGGHGVAASGAKLAIFLGVLVILGTTSAAAIASKYGIF